MNSMKNCGGANVPFLLSADAAHAFSDNVARLRHVERFQSAHDMR
jgi:hypothetical protein